MVHDLKSPLTSIFNYSRLIRENGVLVDEESGEQLRALEEKCADMTERIRCLQEFAAQDETPSQLKPLSLNGLLTDFHRSIRPVIEMSGPDFLLKLPRRECVVLGDKDKLLRVLENLVYNAESFTPAEGRILLTLWSEGGCACFSVADTGAGIPPGELDKVFNRFYTSRADRSGHGLGLTIARSIVMEHAGEITAGSVAGSDAVFTVRLPLYRGNDRQHRHPH